MQSPLGIVLRTAVMLGCLSGLPLLAAGGLDGPDKFFAAANHWWKRHQNEGPLIAPRTVQVELPAEALRYRDLSPPKEQNWQGDSRLPLAEPLPVEIEQRPNVSGQLAHWNQVQRSFPRSEPRILSNWQSDQELQVRNTSDPYAIADAEDQNAPPPTTLEKIEHELRLLGATEVELQPWGSSGRLFRYQAWVSIGGYGDAQRQFQSLQADPLEAAQQVLAQIQKWRRGR